MNLPKVVSSNIAKGKPQTAKEKKNIAFIFYKNCF